jgi:ankyrin repeat protein
MRAMALAFAAALLRAEGDGTTPLHWASYHDDVAGAERLLRSGAEVNASNDLGVTPLWAACQNGSVAMARKLLEAGANPNAALLSGETPVMVAARAGFAEIVELLLARGGNANARATRGQTALMWAAAQKHPAVVKALLARGADVHARTETWKQMMAVPPHGHPEYNRMIPHGGYTALLFAARVGDLESAKLLVAAGANVNDQDAWGVTPAVLAAHSGYGELARFLLDHGADPNVAGAGFTALHLAIMRRDEATVRALLDRGADPNAPLKTWTPTRRSSRDYHFEPALVGATPFWLAARFTQPDVMRLLAKHGADPRVVHRADSMTESLKKRVETTTPVLAALGLGGGRPWVAVPAREREALTLETVKAAADLGVDLKARAADGRTALDLARALNYESVVQFLSRTQ